MNLKEEDLSAYNSPLISFEGKAVVPKRQVTLPVQSGPAVVEVDFIMVDAYSPYTAIVGRPWLHALGVVSSTLHAKVKFPFGGQVEEIVGSQSLSAQQQEAITPFMCMIREVVEANKQLSLLLGETFQAP